MLLFLVTAQLTVLQAAKYTSSNSNLFWLKIELLSPTAKRRAESPAREGQTAPPWPQQHPPPAGTPDKTPLSCVSQGPHDGGGRQPARALSSAFETRKVEAREAMGGVVKPGA